MKPIRELRNIDLKLSSGDLFLSYLKDLHKRKLDMDVWLPSKNMNLQRGNVWNDLQKRELIMSIIYERYIPPIAIISLIDRENQNGEDIKQIIDGKQRLTAMMDFYRNDFYITLEGNYYYFQDLPKDYQSAIARYTVKCMNAYEDYDIPMTDEIKIQWFERINFAGTPMDIEHLNKLKQ